MTADAASSALSDAERLDWLRLIRTENVGPIGFRHLLQQFGSARAALDGLPQLARRAGRARPLKLCPAAEAEREMEALHRLDARLVGRGEPAYPVPLAAIEDAPPLLCTLGDLSLLGRP